MNAPPGISAGTIIGWCVLAAGIGQVPIIVAGLLTARVLPQAGLLLLLLGLPSGLLLFLGGLGLIYRQFAGLTRGLTHDRSYFVCVRTVISDRLIKESLEMWRNN